MKKKILALGALLAILGGCASEADSLWSQAGRDLGVNFMMNGGAPGPQPQDQGPHFFEGH